MKKYLEIYDCSVKEIDGGSVFCVSVVPTVSEVRYMGEVQVLACPILHSVGKSIPVDVFAEMMRMWAKELESMQFPDWCTGPSAYSMKEMNTEEDGI